MFAIAALVCFVLALLDLSVGLLPDDPRPRARRRAPGVRRHDPGPPDGPPPLTPPGQDGVRSAGRRPPGVRLSRRRVATKVRSLRTVHVTVPVT